nr:MAG TPA: conotoxin [Caudoviricetes sp.]
MILRIRNTKRQRSVPRSSRRLQPTYLCCPAIRLP